MKRIAAASVIVSALWAACIVGATLAGAQAYHRPPLLDGFANCALACWNGIVVGRTNIADANRILNAHGYRPVGSMSAAVVYRVGARDCWATLSFIGQNVTALQFSGCEPIALGDMILTFGAPHSLIATHGIGDSVRWRGALIDAGVSVWTSPRAPVSAINLFAPSDSLPSGTRWRGFMPFWDYCRLEPVVIYCDNPAAP